MKDSYGGRRLKSHRNLEIAKSRSKPGKWAVYSLFGTHDLDDGVPFITYVTKVNGKKQRVLGGLSQGIERPYLYTRFNPGKHQLRCPMWTLKKMQDYVK